MQAGKKGREDKGRQTLREEPRVEPDDLHLCPGHGVYLNWRGILNRRGILNLSSVLNSSGTRSLAYPSRARCVFELAWYFRFVVGFEFEWSSLTCISVPGTGRLLE